MLYVYLTKALQNRIGPELTVSGSATRNLDGELAAHSGRPFAAAEKERVAKELSSLMGRDEMNGVISKIERGEMIYAAEYGKALAVVLASTPE
jgi:hypothetical protein